MVFLNSAVYVFCFFVDIFSFLSLVFFIVSYFYSLVHFFKGDPLSVTHGTRYELTTYPDRQTDEVYHFDEILENCQLETFDSEERKILYDALERMYYSDCLKIRDAMLPQEKVRSRMYEIDSGILQSALIKLHQNNRPIKNITGYVMSTIFNCITEEYSLLHIDPYLNSLREVKKE